MLLKIASSAFGSYHTVIMRSLFPSSGGAPICYCEIGSW